MTLTPKKMLFNGSVEEAIEKIEQLLPEAGFSHLGTQHLHQIFKERLSIDDHSKYTVISACAPDIALKALEIDLSVGMLFPCTFVVYEVGPDTMIAHISIMRMAQLLGLGEDTALEPIAQETKSRVEKLWAQLLK